jgi:hypothetical protein
MQVSEALVLIQIVIKSAYLLNSVWWLHHFTLIHVQAFIYQFHLEIIFPCCWPTFVSFVDFLIFCSTLLPKLIFVAIFQACWSNKNK